MKMQEENAARLQATNEVIERNDWLNAKIAELLDANRDNTDYDYADVNALVDEQQHLNKQYDLYDQLFEENGLKGLKDIKGRILVPALYADFGERYHYNYYRGCPVAAYNADDKCALVATDGTGTPLTDFIYDSIFMDQFDETFVCKIGKKQGVFDIHAKMLVPCEMDIVYQAVNGIGGFEQRGKSGLYTTGGLYVAPIFDEMDEKDDYVYVRLGSQWGYVDEEGNFIDENDEEKLDDSCLLCFMPD